MYVFNENMKFDWDICYIVTCSFNLLFILLISATYSTAAKQDNDLSNEDKHTATSGVILYNSFETSHGW